MLPVASLTRATWRKSLIACLTSAIVSLNLSGCASPSVSLTPTPPVFAITTTGTGSSVKVDTTAAGVVLEIYSTSGIGSATIEATAGNTLPLLTLHLHLTGLEELRLIYGQTTLTASVNSGAGQTVTEQAQTAEGAAHLLTTAAPQWADIRIVADNATPVIPLTQGYFAVTLPKDFLSAVNGAPPKTLEVHWIDFYR